VEAQSVYLLFLIQFVLRMVLSPKQKRCLILLECLLPVLCLLLPPQSTPVIVFWLLAEKLLHRLLSESEADEFVRAWTYSLLGTCGYFLQVRLVAFGKEERT
jgi:hypothetical protein